MVQPLHKKIKLMVEPVLSALDPTTNGTAAATGHTHDKMKVYWLRPVDTES
jgi:hypothetical protein